MSSSSPSQPSDLAPATLKRSNAARAIRGMIFAVIAILLAVVLGGFMVWLGADDY